MTRVGRPPLPKEEDERRRIAYTNFNTDREAAEALGITPDTFTAWRRNAGLLTRNPKRVVTPKPKMQSPKRQSPKVMERYLRQRIVQERRDEIFAATEEIVALWEGLVVAPSYDQVAARFGIDAADVSAIVHDATAERNRRNRQREAEA